MDTPESGQAVIDRLVLGESDGIHALSGTAAISQAATRLAEQGQRTLDIYTPDLAKPVYDTIEFVAAVKKLALGNSRAAVRILVQDSTHARKEGHKLILLGQDFSSRIKFKNPSASDEQPGHPFLLVDGTGLLRLTPGRIYEGMVNFNAPAEASELLNAFNRSWEASDPDPHLKRLYI